MKQIHADRLVILIEFLNELPKEKFKFSKITDVCGTVGCAIGWTPTLFPDIVKRIQVYDNDNYNGDVALVGKRKGAFEEVCEHLFDLDSDVFVPGCQRGPYPDLENLRPDATAKQVARVLVHVLELEGFELVAA